ncbi:MAG TPA: hypothetical protein VEG66_03310 [Thermoplasmata archaeon]|jgi:hypothetical protein|nr:hypothetical protein [Thermoplasmata archaeon]
MNDGPAPAPPSTTEAIYAKEWLARFRSRFDEEAGDPRTALGLFYERHRRFVAAPGFDSARTPVYTYEEWNRAFAAFLATLARDFGLVQAPGWTDVPQLLWFWHGVPDRPAVAIREVKVAGDAVVRQEVPSVVKSGALLTVLVLYPDAPLLPGATTVDKATELWKDRVAEELARLAVTQEFLLATISALDWEVPAPWKGFAWQPREQVMIPIR